MEALLLGVGLLLGAYVLVYYNLVKAPPCRGLASLRGRTAVVTGECWLASRGRGAGTAGRGAGTVGRGRDASARLPPTLLRRQQRHREDDGAGAGTPGSARGAGLQEPGARRSRCVRPPPGEGRRSLERRGLAGAGAGGRAGPGGRVNRGRKHRGKEPGS